MLGARIAALRKAAGMNQSQLAQELKISASAVGMYEQGRRQPSVELLAAMAVLFDVSIDFLVTGKPSNSLEQTELTNLLLERINAADTRLEQRSNRPFSREDLAVLFAALLMEP